MYPWVGITLLQTLEVYNQIFRIFKPKILLKSLHVSGGSRKGSVHWLSGCSSCWGVFSHILISSNSIQQKSFLEYHLFKDALCTFVYKSKSEVFRPRYIVLSGIFINTEAALTNDNDNQSKERGMWIVDVGTLFVSLVQDLDNVSIKLCNQSSQWMNRAGSFCLRRPPCDVDKW